MEIRRLDGAPRVVAPDGSEVAILAATHTGSMAQFRLEAGQVAAAVRHRTVDELWFVRVGSGELWTLDGEGRDDVVALEVGVSLAITAGTAFQFRNTGSGPLEIIGVTVPPWPGADEAVPADGRWPNSTGD